MRVPEPKVAKQLAKLARVRERIATAEIDAAARERQDAKDKVEALYSRRFAPENSADMAVWSRWLVWQEQELKVRQAQLARCTAAYHQTVERCGRFVAESEVAKSIVDRSLREAKQKKSKSQDSF